jgi:histidinol dehydrogenase
VAEPRRLDSSAPGFDAELAALIDFEAALDEKVETAVAGILEAVRLRGDAALLEYTERFDRWSPKAASELEVPLAQARAALEALPVEEHDALEVAAARIRAHHEHQRQESWRSREADGTELGQQVTPLDSVGLYVPGGKAAYPSSVLMSAVAAKVAGVPTLVMVTPTPDGKLNGPVLAAAALAGVDRILRVGGAQAVAALAYGTSTVPAVDKIVGPGNAYVAAAKRRVFGRVGIDMVAGPSEVLVIADAGADAEFVAADLLSQAEHGPDSQVLLLSDSDVLLAAVAQQIPHQAAQLPRRDIVDRALAHARLVRCKDIAEAIAISNRYAPEHLILAVREPRRWLDAVASAGSVFLGDHAPEALGDYCSGTNHVLPTYGAARAYSGVSVASFLKQITVQEVTPAGLRAIGPDAATLARAEALAAHERAVTRRLTRLENAS